MSEVREISIKRGLTRLKTIKAQLNDISSKISKYGAGSNKEKFDIVNTNTSRKNNHEEARKEISSLYQQFNDLTKEYAKIKRAINKANLETMITVGDKVMSIDDALTFQRHIQDYVQSMVHSYNRSVMNAESKVTKYNAGVNVEGLTPAERSEELAEVIYLVDRNLVAEQEEFLVEFMTELDGIIDETNAVTKVVIED